MSVKFETKDLGKAKIERELKAAKKLVALVGIPSDSKQHADSNIGLADSNIGLAAIGYILEKGSEVNHLEPRPWMKQTRQRNEKRMMGLSKKILKALSNGSTTAMDAIKKLGGAYELAMNEIFTKGSFEPNAQITIDGGWMRNHVSGKPFKVEGKKSSHPLEGKTGLLRQSITFKVAKV